MGRRTIFVIASVLIAAVGTFFVFMYASKADSAAAAGQAPVEVLVATEAIPAGTSAATIESSGSVELTTLPKASVPATALSDLTSVEGLLNAAPIFVGQVLIPEMFAGVDSTTALSLPKGTMAMAVELSDPQRVAGFVTPGSDVAVFATLEVADTNSTDDTKTVRSTDVLLDRVRVVAVGPTTLKVSSEDEGRGNNNDEEEITTAILTLAVTADQAKRLTFADVEGDLSMALLDPNSEVKGSGAVTNSNIFG